MAHASPGSPGWDAMAGTAPRSRSSWTGSCPAMPTRRAWRSSWPAAHATRSPVLRGLTHPSCAVRARAAALAASLVQDDAAFERLLPELAPSVRRRRPQGRGPGPAERARGPAPAPRPHPPRRRGGGPAPPRPRRGRGAPAAARARAHVAEPGARWCTATRTRCWPSSARASPGPGARALLPLLHLPGRAVRVDAPPWRGRARPRARLRASGLCSRSSCRTRCHGSRATTPSSSSRSSPAPPTAPRCLPQG